MGQTAELPEAFGNTPDKEPARAFTLRASCCWTRGSGCFAWRAFHPVVIVHGASVHASASLSVEYSSTRQVHQSDVVSGAFANGTGCDGLALFFHW